MRNAPLTPQFAGPDRNWTIRQTYLQGAALNELA